MIIITLQILELGMWDLLAHWFTLNSVFKDFDVVRNVQVNYRPFCNGNIVVASGPFWKIGLSGGLHLIIVIGSHNLKFHFGPLGLLITHHSFSGIERRFNSDFSLFTNRPFLRNMGSCRHTLVLNIHYLASLFKRGAFERVSVGLRHLLKKWNVLQGPHEILVHSWLLLFELCDV